MSPECNTSHEHGSVKIAASQLSDKEGLYIKRRKVFIQEAVERGEIEVVQIPTADNRADILTKILPVRQYRRLRDALLNVAAAAENIHSVAVHALRSLLGRASSCSSHSSAPSVAPSEELDDAATQHEIELAKAASARSA